MPDSRVSRSRFTSGYEVACTLFLMVRGESGPNEVIVEAKEVPDSQFVHYRETSAIHPADGKIAKPQEHLPGATAKFSSRLNDLT